MAVFDRQHPWVFAFGLLGNIVSICVMLAPLPTFIRIYREKSTMGYESLPYVVALFSAMLWLYYGLLKIEPLLISVNALGCIIETLYIFAYILYASKQARKYTTKLVAMLNLGAFCAIFVLTNFAVQKEARSVVLGWISVAFSVCVFAAPLSIVFQVVRTRSAEFMPFTLSFVLTLSAVVWFAYGMLKRDICVAVPNVLGFCLGVVQMLLYGIYRKPKPIDEVEKKIPEHVINIGMLGNSEVHPVDSSQTSSNCDVNSIADDEEQQRNKDEDQVDDHMRPEEDNVASHDHPLPDEPPCSQAHVQLNMGLLHTPPHVPVVCPAA